MRRPPKNAVACGHPRVSEAAVETLKAGGNAFDAVIAAGFASAVAEPALTSLGGGGFLLARTAAGQAILFDFFVDTPGRDSVAHEPHFLPVPVHFPGCTQIFNVGLGSAAVPGTLRGYLHAHQRLGRVPLAQVIAPAVELARQGLIVNTAQAYFFHLLEPIMTLTEAGQALYAPASAYLKEGDHFSNPNLADFLETLPQDGDRAFYEGELARRIAQDMHSGQGLLTQADLAAYHVIERRPLAVDYRGYRLLTNPPPSFGGALVALSLQLLEARETGNLKFGSAEHLALLVAAMEEVDKRRDAGYLDPALFASEDLAASLEHVRLASGGTTHVSVCDAQGNVASMTTSNGEGSGYIVPGTGVMLNNMMGEDDLHPEGFHSAEPGLRVASMMSPSVLLQDEQVQLVVGSGGSKRIRTALLQVVSDVVDFGMTVEQAIAAPRLHWDGECVQLEPGFSDSVLEALKQRWPINLWPVQDVYFGGVHAVSPCGEGTGDRRRGGHAMVFE